MILFVSGTGTGIGKTAVTRGLVAGLCAAEVGALAVKPLETGCEPDPMDALALSRASGRTDRAIVDVPSFYRVQPPLAPYAATLRGATAPDFDGIVNACRELERRTPQLIIEGAGGLLVPLDARRTTADLAAALDAHLVLVAPDRLGVLSDTLAVLEAAASRRLPVAVLVLNRGAAPTDPSRETNLAILRERCPAPVIAFEACADNDQALAQEAARSGLLTAVRRAD